MNQNERELLESEKLVTIQDYVNLFNTLVDLTSSGNKEIKAAINDVALNLKLKVAYIIKMSQPYITQPGFWARWKERRLMKKQAKSLDRLAEKDVAGEQDLEQRISEQEEALKKIEIALQTKDFSTLLENAPTVPQIEEQSSSGETDDVLKF